MIVYNHQLLFLHEPQFNFTIADNIYQTIDISKRDSFLALKNLKFKTLWQTLSGEKIRYIAEKPFSLKNKPISWALEVSDVVLLFWNAQKREIFYYPKINYTADKLLFWILHTFFPLVLELEGSNKILHVGGVEVSGRSVLFSALSYGGKSTLTDYFLTKGHRLLSDDSIGIKREDNNYYIIPSYPYYRPHRELGSLGYFTKSFSCQPKLLHNIYVLKKINAKGLVKINEVHGVEKFKSLHISGFVMFDFMQKERFDFFTTMAQSVCVYEITIPWDLERVDEVYQAMVAHIAV